MMTPVPPTKKKLKVAIVGGGVSGLTCALALIKQGVDVEVYEAAAKFGEIGAAIFLGPNTVPILEKIGVLHTIVFKLLWGEGLVRTLTLPFRGREFFQFISGMEGHEVLCDASFKHKDHPENNNALAVHRADFLDSLVQHIDPKITHFNKRCMYISTSSTPDPETGSHKHIMHFKDGTTAEADVVLGADGLKSIVRRYVTDPEWMGEPNKYHDPHLTYSNNYCYRALVPYDKARAAGVKETFARPVQYCGEDRHIVVAAIKGATLIQVVAFVTDSSKDYGTPLVEPAVLRVSKEELLADYRGWGSDIQALLSCIEEPDRWNINVVFPFLDTYARDKVALVGDSAHAMQPHLGAGASVGLEDAHCVAELLGNPQTTVENAGAVLQAYSEVRRPRAREVWDGGVRANKVYEGHNPKGRYFEPDDIRSQYYSVWHHPVDTEVNKAVELLKEQGVFS